MYSIWCYQIWVQNRFVTGRQHSCIMKCMCWLIISEVNIKLWCVPGLNINFFRQLSELWFNLLMYQFLCTLIFENGQPAGVFSQSEGQIRYDLTSGESFMSRLVSITHRSTSLPVPNGNDPPCCLGTELVHPCHTHIDSLVQDCSNSGALAMQLLRYCQVSQEYHNWQCSEGVCCLGNLSPSDISWSCIDFKVQKNNHIDMFYGIQY